jgi:hypothetical protein
MILIRPNDISLGCLVKLSPFYSILTDIFRKHSFFSLLRRLPYFLMGKGDLNMDGYFTKKKL